MDSEEYEVESITRARVHDKRGKKITWRYYVKWKGYDWDECTWEPTESFQGGSEHILEGFWERIDTNGRDISDASVFKKGEELLISGPPGKKGLKRKANGSKAQAGLPSEDNTGAHAASLSVPLLTPRKRRRRQVASDDEDEIQDSKPKRKERTVISPPRPNRRVSMGGRRNAAASAKAPKRRRASSPGPRKQAHKRQLSAGDSQLDADGETDPDIVEVEEELMLVSGEDMEDGPRDPPVTTSARANGRTAITFDDLEHFYNGNPIDIDQTADELMQIQKPAVRPPPQLAPSVSLAPEYSTPEPQVPDFSNRASPDPLFDSPEQFPEQIQTRENQRESSLPFHRARAANPLVKLIDPTTTENKGAQSRITAKARLMFIPHTSASGSSRQTARPGGKSGLDSSFSNKNRSSLLTTTRGILKSVKGKFAAPNIERDPPDVIEEIPAAWDDEGAIEQVEAPQSSSAPTGEELLTLAGLQNDAELPAYEDEDAPATQENAAEEPQGSSTLSAPAKDKLPEEPSSEVVEVPQAGDQLMDSASFVAEPDSQASNTVVADASVSSVVTHPSEEVVKKNIELAKEQLFPSTHTSYNTFSDMSGSFKSTIFGPLFAQITASLTPLIVARRYQGVAVNLTPVAENELSSTFRLIYNDTVELPLVLKDRNQLKVRINDILISRSGKLSGRRVAFFYGSQDATAIVNALKSGGTARVVLDPTAEISQREHFTTLLQRFESSHTLIAPAGGEVCVLYMSDNTSVAEKLDAPTHLVGLSRTLLISHASIENPLAYVTAVMKASALDL